MVLEGGVRRGETRNQFNLISSIRLRRLCMLSLAVRLCSSMDSFQFAADRLRVVLL